MEEKDLAAQLKYDGSADLREQWHAFAEKYIAEGNKKNRVHNLELLNELVFKLPADLVKEPDPTKRPAIAEQRIKDFLQRHGSNGNYENLRAELQDVVKANAAGDVGNTLNKAIVNNLANLWLALEQARNLPVLPEHAGLQKTPEYEAHQQLIRSPEGGLISGTLLAASDGALKAQASAVANRYKAQGIAFSQVYSLAFDVYKSTLFRYEGDRGAAFLTYLTNRLKQLLPRQVLGEIDDAVSLDAEFSAGKKGGDGGTRYDLIPDEKAEDPLASAILSDDRTKIEGWLKKLFTRDAEIIRLRFGLGDAEFPRTLEEVGEIIGVTRERIRQIEARAMGKLREMAGASEKSVPDKPKPRDPDPEKQPTAPVTPPKQEEDVPPASSVTTRRKPDLDFDRARRLAEENAGAKRDLIQDGVAANLASKLDAILSHKNGSGTALFGIENEPLRVSQQETLEKFSHALHDSKTAGYAVLPGGCGKTRIGITACAAAKDASQRSIYIVPSILAAEGVCKELKRCRPDISVGRVYDDHAEFDKDVTVIVYNSLYRHFYKSLIAQADGQEYPFNIRDYRLIVADEAHTYLTELANHIFQNTDAVRLALTATDKYYEGKEVKDRFGHCINRVDLDQAIMRKEILRPKYRCVETKVDLGLDEIYDLDQRDEFYSKEIEQHVNTPQWNQVFVDVWRGDADPETGKRIVGDKTFVHCAGIQHATDIADRFNAQLEPLLRNNEQFRAALIDKGINPDKVEHIAAPISHRMNPKARQELLEKYNRREILVLTSSKMLIESVDDPGTNVIMNAVPTYSRVRAAQRGYRGSRTSNGKDSWYIYEALPADWENSKYAPVLFAEAAEDPQIEGIRGTPRSKPVRSSETAVETPEGYKVHWEYADVAEILNRLYLIRQRQQGLDALDPDWLDEYDNQRGRYLEALRLRAGMSRRDAAEAIGVSDGTIFNYERGRGFQDIKPASKSGLGVERFIELIRPIYKTTAEEEKRLLQLFLPALDPDKFVLIPEEERPAVLLKSFRLRAGVDQKTVARALGKDDSFQATLSAWERRGTNSFNRAFLEGMSVGELIEKLTPLYRLSKDESQLLLNTLLPALNPEWLAKQPAERQVGLYLNALRRRGSSYSYEAMIENLGIEFNWEKRGGIDPSKLPIPFEDLLGKLKQFYQLSDQEVERITHLVLPALNPENLKKIPEEKRLGELLSAYRKRASLRQDTAGVKIGEVFDADKPKAEKRGAILFGTVSGWETRVTPPLTQNSGIKEYIGAIMDAYKLSDTEREQLMSFALPMLSPAWLNTQPPEKQVGLMLMGYRQIVGQKRQDVADTLGIDMRRLGEYEKGDRPIPQDVFDKAVAYFSSKCGKLFNESEFCQRYTSPTYAPIKTAEPEIDENQRGQYLKHLREAAHLSVEDAAAKMGVSAAALSNYESGGGFEVVRHQHGRRMGVAKFVEIAGQTYGANATQSQKLLHLFLPALDPVQQERIPLEDRLPSLLKSYRLRAGLETGEVAEVVGISPTFDSTLGKWENGNSRPDRIPPSDITIGKFIQDITPVYKLSDTEAKGLMEAFFPALNKEWLYWQPQEQQLGLLLKSYRLRGSTLTREEAEKKLGFSLKAEKSADRALAPSRLGIPLDEIISRVKNTYGLSDEETASLKDIIAPSQDNVSGWPLIKSRREVLGLSLEAAAEKIGIKWQDLAAWERRQPPINRNSGIQQHFLDIMKAYDVPPEQKDTWVALVLPALSKEWLQDQPEKQRAGLMLMAYRQHTGLTREQFSELVDISDQVLGKYENGNSAIPSVILDKAIAYFKQNCADLFDEQQFRNAYDQSNAAFANQRRSIDPRSPHIRNRTGRTRSRNDDGES